MKQVTKHIMLLLALSLLGGSVVAQRISFGLYAADDLVIMPLGLGELNFNDKKTIILGGETVTINMTDDAAAILTIEGRTDLDINVTITYSTTIDLDPLNKIPLAVKFAYSNIGASTYAIARGSAIQVPTGFTTATFPIVKRASGLPTPPPTPNHTGYTGTKRTAYLFIYGTLGAVPADAAAGIYTGNINIHVEYSTY